MPSNWLVFDRIRALVSRYNIYQADRTLQDQSYLDRLMVGGDVMDYSIQSAVFDQTNLFINRLERYKDYEQMDQMGEISLALDLYADEACITGDTVIPLADGSRPTVAELAEKGEDYKFKVYSYDLENNEYVIAEASCARVSGRNVDVVKVDFGGGGSIRCTSDHLFMLADGTYVKAAKLVPGDCLKAACGGYIPPSVGKLGDCAATLARKLKKLFRINQSSCDASHTVISVTECGVVDKVYDIEVPKYHCFAAGTDGSWVIIHNSLMDPEHKHTIIIKARNRRLKRELERLFFDILLWDSHCRPAIRYLCKYGDFPFEIVPTVERDGVQSLKFMDVYNFTRVETRYGDLVGFFHFDPIQQQPVFLHPWQVVHFRLTSFENIYHPYGKCLAGDSLISTPAGPTPIKDIRPGDEVYAWDTNDQKLVSTKVLAQVCSGNKRVIKIRTRNSFITCTPEHLVWVDGQGYKMAEHIQIGDRLLRPSIEPQDALIPLALDNPDKNCVIPRLPDYVDEKFARLFGFLIGDGWATDHVGFAFSVYPEKNEKYISIFNDYGLHLTFLRQQPDASPYAARCSNKLFVKLLRKMGLIGKANEKTVPEWVFRASREIQIQFIKGYIDADGCRRKDGGYTLTSTSYDLLCRTRMLIKNLGFKCGKVSGPRGNNSHICGRHCNSNDIYQLHFYFSKKESNCLTDRDTLAEAVAMNTSYAGVLRSFGYKPYGSMYELLKQRINEYNIDTSHFKGNAWNKGGSVAVLDPPKVETAENRYITEQVIDIEELDEAVRVYDIQVDHEASNFIADGIVVHNSIIDGGRKAFKQLRLMEDAALIYRICLTGDSKVWTDCGYKRIDDIKIGDNVYCYNNDGVLELTRVTNQVCNGVHDVYKVSTKYRELCGTVTHPFLVKNIYTNIVEYVDLRDLDPERHLIVSPRISGDGEEKQITLWSDREYAKLTPELETQFRSSKYDNISEIMRSIDHPVYLMRQFLYLNKGMPKDKAIELCDKLGLNGKLDIYTPGVRGGSTLPNKVDAEFARFIGFYFGDGFITNVNWRVGLSLGSNDDINRIYINLFRKYHKRVKLEHKNENGVRRLNAAVVCDKQLYKTFVSLGLGGGAHGKRIPDWVYKLPLSHKIEFVKGFIDADGYEFSGDCEYYGVEICNKQLLEDLKVLCDQIGWKTGKITSRTRNGGMAHMTGEYTVYSLFINPSFKDGYEKITDISYVGREKVYDISVENKAHNFIANGCAVHNTRAPEKRKFIIPVGLIPPKEAAEYMQAMARMLKRRRFYNPTTGTFDERYSPLIQEDDFILPRRADGTGPDVDVLPGAENLDQIADIEYFKKKMIAPTKIPFSRVGIGEKAGEYSEKSLSQSHAEFAKAVQWVQREIAVGLTKIALVHLALRGYTVEDMRGFDIALTATSAMEDLYRIETWQTRASVMADLKDLGWFPKKWIVSRFTDLSPDEIEEIDDMNNEEPEEQSGGGGGGGIGAVGGVEGGEPEAEEETGGAEVPDIGDLTGLPVEGFDYDAYKRLLVEVRKYEHAKKQLADYAVRDIGLDYFLINNELDGLTRAKYANGEEIYNPNSDNGVIIEWSVPEELRNEAIEETKQLLIEGYSSEDE